MYNVLNLFFRYFSRFVCFLLGIVFGFVFLFLSLPVIPCSFSQLIVNSHLCFHTSCLDFQNLLVAILIASFAVSVLFVIRMAVSSIFLVITPLMMSVHSIPCQSFVSSSYVVKICVFFHLLWTEMFYLFPAVLAVHSSIRNSIYLSLRCCMLIPHIKGCMSCSSFCLHILHIEFL